MLILTFKLAISYLRLKIFEEDIGFTRFVIAIILNNIDESDAKSA